MSTGLNEQQLLANIIAEIQQLYTADPLKTIYNDAYMPFFQHYGQNDARRRRLEELGGFAKGQTKEALIGKIAIVYLDKEIHEAFLNYLPDPVRKLFMHILWNRIPLTVDQAEKICGESLVMNETGSYGYRVTKLKEAFYCLSWFAPGYLKSVSYGYYYSSEKKPIGMPESLAIAAQRFHEQPPEFHFRTLTEPEGAAWVFQDKGRIIPAMTTLISWIQQKTIPYSSTGKPNVSTYKRFSVALGNVNFFGSGAKPLANARAETIYPVISRFIGKSSLPDGKISIGAIWRSLSTYEKLDLNIFADYLGFKGTNRLNNHYVSNFQQKLKDLIAMIPEEGWVPVKALMYELIKKDPIIDVYPVSNITYSVIDKSIGERISPQSVLYGFTVPYYKHVLCVLGGLGLLDLAFDGEEPEMPVYQSLKYVKLNAFGAYITGRTQVYVPESDANQTFNIHLDEQTLVIRLDSDIENAETLLAEFAKPLPGRRFRVSPDVFLKDCKNAKDIKAKIARFKFFVGVELPPLWSGFFNTLLQRAQTVAEESGYNVFILHAEDRELISHVARDPVLREICIKAENYHVLVEKENTAKFKTRLRELGYLI